MSDHSHESVIHIAPVGLYYTVFGSLLGLTLLTVVVSYAPLGEFHTPVALFIAAIKASLVLLFFMHLLHSPRLTWLAMGGALLTFGIMILITLSDYLTRSWMERQTAM